MVAIRKKVEVKYWMRLQKEKRSCLLEQKEWIVEKFCLVADNRIEAYKEFIRCRRNLRRLFRKTTKNFELLEEILMPIVKIR